jgi:hypothetical protein
MKKVFRYLINRTTLLITLILILNSCQRSDSEVFHDFFEFYPPSDVKEFHFIANEGFLDSSYWISFECNHTTAEKIISKLSLLRYNEATDGLGGGLNSKPTAWWDHEFIENSVPYTKRVYSDHYYFWYDNYKGRVYFLLFDT